MLGHCNFRTLLEQPNFGTLFEQPSFGCSNEVGLLAFWPWKWPWRSILTTDLNSISFVPCVDMVFFSSKALQRLLITFVDAEKPRVLFYFLYIKKLRPDQSPSRPAAAGKNHLKDYFFSPNVPFSPLNSLKCLERVYQWCLVEDARASAFMNSYNGGREQGAT